MPKKERLDTLLVRVGHFASREQAQRSILAGLVKVGGVLVTKAGTPVDPELPLSVEPPKTTYVSRGGFKLKAALEAFQVDVQGRIALDVGASTGGFTDVLLKGGARLVYAVDVGYGQLAWELRQDPRVRVFERTNIRYLPSDALAKEDGRPDLAVIDVSFIGLGKVLPAVWRLLSEHGDVIALIKPQFEAGREHVGKGGVVREAKTHVRVLEAVVAQASELGYHLWGLTHSPIKGPEGNIEFLAYWRRTPPNRPPETPVGAVARAHAAVG